MTDSQGLEPVAVLCAECARGVLSLGWPVYVRLDWWREHVGVPDPAGAAAQFELLTGRSIADGESQVALHGAHAFRFLDLAARRRWRIYSPAVGEWCPRGLVYGFGEFRCEVHPPPDLTRPRGSAAA